MSMRRPWLLPLVPLYAAALALKNRGYARNRGHAQRLSDPVISVGSLSAGGAGKTPFVIALGEALRRAGYGIDVLSRGHGRRSTLDLRVLPHGTAEGYGDEPLLIAQQLACPVYVARQRYAAGELAERERRIRRDSKRLSFHLLDDGFQHRQLARAVDVVLLTAEDVTDTLLPAGNLREPLRALRRADIVVLRAEEAEALQPVLRRLLPSGKTLRQWIVQRRAVVLERGPSQRPLAFCGVARPDGFRASLRELGINPAAVIALRDHQQYNAEMVNRLIQQAKAAGADGFVTTAKDAVKLTDDMRRQFLTVGPLLVCDIAVFLNDEAGCVHDVLELVQGEWDRRLQR